MTQQNTLDNFVKEIVDGWMLQDLINLTKIPVVPNKAGNCNFPIALYTFSCLEFLGQLTPVTPIDAKQPGYTEKRILGFINEFFPEEAKQQIAQYRNYFVTIFRHGLAHEYFAKNAGISRTESVLLHVDNDGRLVLDADRFAEAFIAAVLNLKKVIDSDEDLSNRIVSRYNEHYRGNLGLYFTPPTTTSTTSSGASLPHPEMTKNLHTTTLPYDPEDENS